jgi:hypothetical protein
MIELSTKYGAKSAPVCFLTLASSRFVNEKTTENTNSTAIPVLLEKNPDKREIRDCCADLLITWSYIFAVLPVIGSERRGGQSGLIIQVATFRVFTPGVTDRDGIFDFIGPDNNGVSVNFCVGPDKFPVFSRNRELFQLSAFTLQAAADMEEFQSDFTFFRLHAQVGWT